MYAPDPTATLRHNLANPLAALLAEAQLLLMDAERLDPDVVRGLKEIERQAGRMRDLLHQSKLR